MLKGRRRELENGVRGHLRGGSGTVVRVTGPRCPSRQGGTEGPFARNPLTQCDTVDVLKSEGETNAVTGEKRRRRRRRPASAADEIEGCEEEPLAARSARFTEAPAAATAVWIPRIQPCRAARMVSAVCPGCRCLRRRPCRPEDVGRGDSVSEPAEDEGDKGDDDDDDA